MKPRSSHPSKANPSRATKPKAAGRAGKAPTQSRPSEAGRQIPDDRGALLLLEKFPLPESVLVNLTCYEPAAEAVFVAGTFNDWQAERDSMSLTLDGQWSIDLILKPGRYEYRFVVDGEWKDDPMAQRYVANPFGGLNSVIEVSIQ